MSPQLPSEGCHLKVGENWKRPLLPSSHFLAFLSLPQPELSVQLSSRRSITQRSQNPRIFHIFPSDHFADRKPEAPESCQLPLSSPSTLKAAGLRIQHLASWGTVYSPNSRTCVTPRCLPQGLLTQESPCLTASHDTHPEQVS